MAELTPEYIEKMEDVLNIYEKPLNSKSPVVCMDEKSLQLLKNSRPPYAFRPGRVARQDNEYIRAGTANVFCAVEPKAGRHLTRVTSNRKIGEFAKMILRISRAYPRAKKIHLVMDNLNTHKKDSLIHRYGNKKGKHIWNRFKVHYTPKHGSWLNQAEIEIGLLARQCLGKDRIGSMEELKQRVSAWNKIVNRKKVTIDWKFTTKKARTLFYYK